MAITHVADWGGVVCVVVGEVSQDDQSDGLMDLRAGPVCLDFRRARRPIVGHR